LASTRWRRGGCGGAAGSSGGTAASELTASEKKEVQSARRRASNCLFQGATCPADWTLKDSAGAAKSLCERDAKGSSAHGVECDEGLSFGGTAGVAKFCSKLGTSARSERGARFCSEISVRDCSERAAKL